MSRTHRLGKCDSEQARAEEAKTGNGYSEETVRSEFFTCHGTPPTARQCSLPPAIGSSRLAARLERLRLMTQLYVGTRPMPKGIGRVIRRFVTAAFQVPSFPDVSGLSHPDESSSGSWNTESIHETSKHKFEDHGECCYSDKALALVFQFKVTDRLSA